MWATLSNTASRRLRPENAAPSPATPARLSELIKVRDREISEVTTTSSNNSDTEQQLRLELAELEESLRIAEADAAIAAEGLADKQQQLEQIESQLANTNQQISGMQQRKLELQHFIWDDTD